MVLFASDRDVHVLAESEILVGDATFKCAPRGFSQVYTLHGKVFSCGGTSVGNSFCFNYFAFC